MEGLVGQLIAAFLGTLGFCILYNVPSRFYMWCGLTGSTGWLVYQWASQLTTAPGASFIAACIIVLLSRILAVYQRCPITIFLVSGVFPLIPGASLYYTVFYLMHNDFVAAGDKGLMAIKIVFAIVIAIVFTVSIPKKWFMTPKFKKIQYVHKSVINTKK